MKRLEKSWTLTAVLAVALIFALAPHAAAQGLGGIHGQIIDPDGGPWADLVIQAVSDQGAKTEAKTDKDGKFVIRNLRTGVYSIVVQLPGSQHYNVDQIRVPAGGEASEINLNFKEILEKQNPSFTAEKKKQQEEKQKFEGMKEHFAAGNALVDKERQAKAALQDATADKRDSLKQSLVDLSNQAEKEFKDAQKAAPEKDPNQHLIWAKLAEVYDLAGRNDEAVQAYQQAVTTKPDPGYYNNLGNILARTGKIDEAKAAYTKSAELDPPNAAMAWRNFGISLYNANRLGDAVEPLQKAAELDPKSAQTWYLLGASLVYKMTTKKVGDKEEIVLAPGTVEAYEKAIELDPNGKYGAQAKLGLEQLQQMGASGIQTKVNMKKKKS